MPRPARQRIVTGRPAVAVFKPAGVRARDLEWTNLTLDEFEAIRLIDGQDLDQEAVAEQMAVSRPTVTRILASARTKIAHVLVTGRALRIEGGPVRHAGPGHRGVCDRRGQRGRRAPGRGGEGHGGRSGRRGRRDASFPMNVGSSDP
ncbi:MAG: DUF134 domain-containing protein [Phycisphaerales bacterium]|nr:MAG: DUF134 domain-containing protein [Phycisphaerales bacterium]